VHLDLKPSNVLLARDGQPLLLDFHLSREPVRPGGPPPDHLGGTPAYMPPEQRAAMRALEDATAIPDAVDRRADLYALGAILYESLGGPLPRATSSPPLTRPTLTRLNPQVSRGLADIITRCMAERPDERYPDAGAVADDLRRHLTDQPLAGVANRSLAERWRKWRRRQPAGFQKMMIIAVAVLAGALLLAGLRLREERAAVARRELAQQVHLAAEEVRALYCADGIPPEDLRVLTRQCESLWRRRDSVLGSLGSLQTMDVRSDLQDLAVCTASLQLRSPPDTARPDADRRRALRLLDEAEAGFGRSAVIELERRNAMDSGGTRVAAPSPPGATPPPATAWEHTAIGRALLRRGDLPAAFAELRAAVTLQPAGRWSNYYFGVCAYRMGRPDDAVAAFSVAIGGGPDVPEFFHNRALAYLALGRPEDARRDGDRAAALRRPPNGRSLLEDRPIR
jgi:tetratricopeptide (TPR) repeat protein